MLQVDGIFNIPEQDNMQNKILDAGERDRGCGRGGRVWKEIEGVGEGWGVWERDGGCGRGMESMGEEGECGRGIEGVGGEGECGRGIEVWDGRVGWEGSVGWDGRSNHTHIKQTKCSASSLQMKLLNIS